MVQERPAALQTLQKKLMKKAKAKKKSSMFERAIRTRSAWPFELKEGGYDSDEMLPPGRHEKEHNPGSFIIVNDDGTGRIEKLSHHVDKEEALSLLASVGIKKLAISFYGGHDEGCENGATATIGETEVRGEDTEDLLIGDPSIRYANHGFGNRDGTKEDWKIAAAQLCENLGSPIWSKYGSFAGDYNVDGQLVYDIEEGTIILEGNESSWEPFSEMFEVNSNQSWSV